MNRIETNDLFKGAYLLSQSFKLKETRFVNSHQVRFVIEGEDINEKDQMYHTGQALDPLMSGNVRGRAKLDSQFQ